MKKELNCEIIFNDFFNFINSNFNHFEFDFINKEPKFYYAQFYIDFNNEFYDFKRLKNFLNSFYKNYPRNFNISYNLSVSSHCNWSKLLICVIDMK